MAPKLSLIQFNRTLAVTINALQLARKKTDELNSVPQAQAISQATYLEASLKAELKDFESFIAPYMSSDTLCEGLSDEVLQERVSEIKGLFTDLLWSLAKYIGLANPLASSTVIDNQNSMNVVNSSIVLPKIKLNKFSGNYTEFPSFLARFETLVDSSPHLSVSQKFEFLLGHLEGEALNVVKHLPFTGDNYTSALTLLKDRYFNVRRAVSIHTNEILDLPSLANKAESIREFLDKYQVNFSSLENFIKDKCDIHVQDLIHVQFVLSKFPWSLRDLFEKSVANVDFPTINQVLDFLKCHVKALENATLGTPSLTPSPSRLDLSKGNKSMSPVKNKPYKNKSVSSLATNAAPMGCFNCSSKDHDVFSCVQFSMLNPRERFKVVKDKKMCVRCLLPSHKGKCTKSKPCDTCASEGHHTWLHFTDRPLAASCVAMGGDPKRNGVLLPTALVRLQVSPTQYVVARAFLDTCSHVCLVTENLVQQLNCSRLTSNLSISGVDFAPACAKGRCELSVCDLKGKVIAPNYPFHIVKNVTFDNPTFQVPAHVVKKANRYILADPTFHLTSRVDILLSADVVASSILCPSVASLGDGLPVVLFTAFGSVIWGGCPLPSHSKAGVGPSLAAIQTGVSSVPVASLIATIDERLNESVQRFWSVEEVPAAPKLSAEELECENYFNTTTVRLPCGRYQVRLPFVKNGRSLLGSSYDNALARLRSLERRFKVDPSFKELYAAFMHDYESKGHMKLVTDPSVPRYFIPHHGVYKTHGETSKIRVVFDASAKSSSDHSLNSVLLSPPNVVALLSDVMTLFRTCRYVFSSDLEQMYRQIRVHPEDAPFQCILWRDDDSCDVKCYVLTTVTYGVGPSAYLAIATLFRLANDEAHRFPRAAHTLLRRSYVDDINGGCDCLQMAFSLRNELISLLSAGGFTLKKWSSNSLALLRGIPEDARLPKDLVRVLGLPWNPESDSFEFPIDEMIMTNGQPDSKRTVLAQTAKLYDPCGYAAPVIMYAKCFFQQLWRLPLDWDAPLPTDLQETWLKFKISLDAFRGFEVPRHLSCIGKLQLHGFSDASMVGYSAVLYLRSETEDVIKVSLVCSKTRVAPLRPTSIPRLELLGAHLLAKLANHYRALLEPEVYVKEVILWTDSSIVLNWLKIEPHRLKTFVANRVADINAWSYACHWRHVPGIDNPADVASRGVPTVSELTPTWLSGPSFLTQPPESWPVLDQVSHFSDRELELKSSTVGVLVLSEPLPDLFARISRWSSLLRVVSIVARWRLSILADSLRSPVENRETALIFIVRFIQLQAFSEDLKALERGRLPRPAIQRLAPVIDNNGVLRIKGRLTHARILSRPCPILLPKKHRLVDLLIQHYHESLGHAGPLQTHFQIAWSYWILSARQVIRRVIHGCVRCFRSAPRSSAPLMADLPSVRVNPSPPFWHSGTDYCGPFLVRPYPLRKATLVKVYLCIFICMSTKAVHLEVAHDLSAASFLDVLKRFVSRRGIPARLYSDCGSNFIGARALLDKELKNLLSQLKDNVLFKEFLLNHKIDFCTIPPSAPHQGGLWERAVGSTKFHLKRVVGANTLILSQLITLVTQIEAILNSRPLTPVPSDTEDLSVLTPAHFIIGRPLTTLPEEDLTECLDGSLRHYQLITALVQRFWRQWRLEYLSTLQSRSKWTAKSKDLEVGDIVVLSEPNCPPLMWPLGRIDQVFPSADGVVRRVMVSTKGGCFERPAIKVFRLPIQNN